MRLSRLRPCLAAAVLALGAPVLRAEAPAGPATAEAQLREALRSATLQLRTAQGDFTGAKAEKEQAQRENEDLAKRLAELERQAAADRTAARTNLANLNSQLAAKDAESARLAEALKKAKDANDEAVRVSNQREQARVELVQLLAEQTRTASELRAQNRELFRIGNEVLDRYESFGLGQALAAREPFTKLTRVKLQNLVQDYRDELETQRAKLPAVAPAATTAATP